MQMGFSGQLCSLCEVRPSTTGDGEDAWPRWLLKRFRGTGPFTLYENDTPFLKRDGVTPRRSEGFPGVKLPACDVCNPTLNRRFEEPAKPIIRRVFDAEAMLELSAEEAYVLAEWFVKTWLLLAHPAARHGEPRMIQKSWNLDLVIDDLYGWMTDGSPPPDSVSMWLMRQDLTDANDGELVTLQTPLPSISADGRLIKFQSIWLGLDVLEATLVYHPHWPIDLPLEVEGRVARLWPRYKNEPLDLAALPPVHSREMSWLSGIRVVLPPDTFGVVPLPPLSPDTRLYELPEPILGVMGESRE